MASFVHNTVALIYSCLRELLLFKTCYHYVHEIIIEFNFLSYMWWQKWMLSILKDTTIHEDSGFKLPDIKN